MAAARAWEVALLSGTHARRLALRGLPDAGSPGHFALRADRLEDRERRWLERSVPARPTRSAWAHREPGEIRVCVDLEVARRDAPHEPLAGLIDACARALASPPSPPRIVGVLNVTPDSFSDGGLYVDCGRAVAHAERLLAEGADEIDVGGESTRSGAVEVDADTEVARTRPVVEALALRSRATIAIDTRKAAVARAALDAGASVVNDVSAGTHDPRMADLVAERGCAAVLMHMRGTPATMQSRPTYGDVVADVLEHLRERTAAWLAAGVSEERLRIDPGIGFGKDLEQNLALLARVAELRSLGLPLYVGVSRKSFIARVNAAAGRPPGSPPERLGGTAAAVAACVAAGVESLRVHDVATMAEAARVAFALRSARVRSDDPCSERGLGQNSDQRGPQA